MRDLTPPPKQNNTRLFGLCPNRSWEHPGQGIESVARQAHVPASHYAAKRGQRKTEQNVGRNSGRRGRQGRPESGTRKMANNFWKSGMWSNDLITQGSELVLLFKRACMQLGSVGMHGTVVQLQFFSCESGKAPKPGALHPLPREPSTKPSVGHGERMMLWSLGWCVVGDGRSVGFVGGWQKLPS